MSPSTASGRAPLRWLFTLAIATFIVYVLPPQGITNAKFFFALLSGSGIALTGLWEARLLRREPEHPLKAIGIGAGIRTIIVVLAIVVVKYWLPPDMLIGTAIGVMIFYFAVQIIELPTLITIVGEAKKDSKESA